MRRRWFRLARLLPLDPEYAPFGWRWLRGFNAFTFVLYIPIAFSRSMGDFRERVTFRGAVPFQAAFIDALQRVPARALVYMALWTVLMIAAVAALNLTEGRTDRWRIGGLFAALLAASLVNMSLGWQLFYAIGMNGKPWSLFYSYNVATVIGQMTFGSLAAIPLYLRRRRQAALRALRETKLQRVNAERHETEARLQSLQAQIEPHFLFNTLAHILRLHQVDAKRGRAMLQSLTEYMRSALPQVRSPDFTLARELALTRAYVNVQQIRMGERLRVEIEVAPELDDARVPAMTVLTLAENAVKHGLGPKREGGTLRIEAGLDGDMLEVAVCDDGVGLQLGAGTGHGLSNTRSRLAAAYGRRAALRIGNREGGGVRAVLRLPFAPVAAVARP